jgi:hypothetical protein
MAATPAVGCGHLWGPIIDRSRLRDHDEGRDVAPGIWRNFSTKACS